MVRGGANKPAPSRRNSAYRASSLMFPRAILKRFRSEPMHFHRPLARHPYVTATELSALRAWDGTLVILQSMILPDEEHT